MAKHFITSTETVYTDENGQERVRETKKVISQKETQDSFYMTFYNYVQWIYQLKSVNTIKLLYKLLELADFNTGEFTLGAGKRKEIMDDLGIGKSAFAQALAQLVSSGAVQNKKKVIVDEETGEVISEEILKGEYIVSPIMFWKGELKKRAELKVTFEAVYTDEIEGQSQITTTEFES